MKDLHQVTVMVIKYCRTSLHVLTNNYCADIVECSTNNGGCGGTCINTAGSYYCTCPSGCTLGSNNHACNGKLCILYSIQIIAVLKLDINECIAGTDNCEHNCLNTGNCGGYGCSCNTGYTLDSNGYSCIGQSYMHSSSALIHKNTTFIL